MLSKTAIGTVPASVPSLFQTASPDPEAHEKKSVPSTSTGMVE
jgi:hypothetical protein